jgi:hypothetical protein
MLRRQFLAAPLWHRGRPVQPPMEGLVGPAVVPEMNQNGRLGFRTSSNGLWALPTVASRYFRTDRASRKRPGASPVRGMLSWTPRTRQLVKVEPCP